MNDPNANPAARPRPRLTALKVAAIGAEAVVVASLATSSYHIAFAGPDPDWLAGAPILTVVALESMRLPLAFRFRHMRLTGVICGVLMLGGLSVITGEAASLAFENLIFQRTRPVIEAETALARAEISHDALAKAADRRAEEISRLTADIASARAHRASIDRPPELQTAPSGRTCSGRRGLWNCGAAVQAEAVRANAAAQKAHADELRDASAQVKASKARLAAVDPAPDMRSSDANIAEAKRKVADARSLNPMFRVAAAWQRTPVEDLASEQFEQVKHWAVIALSIATALATALAAVISSLPERSEKPSKLSLALRRMIAARRKTLRRLRETVRTEYRDRFIHVPVDPVSGRVLDADVRP
jgi:hypothetical protein